MDLLAWFSEEEWGVCDACGQRACATMPEAHASFCLGCGAVSISGKPIDVDRRVAAA